MKGLYLTRTFVKESREGSLVEFMVASGFFLRKAADNEDVKYPM